MVEMVGETDNKQTPVLLIAVIVWEKKEFLFKDINIFCPFFDSVVCFLKSHRVNFIGYMAAFLSITLKLLDEVCIEDIDRLLPFFFHKFVMDKPSCYKKTSYFLLQIELNQGIIDVGVWVKFLNIPGIYLNRATTLSWDS